MKENFFEKTQESEKEIVEQKKKTKEKTPKRIVIKDNEGITIQKQEARFVVNEKGETVDIKEEQDF